MKPTKEMSIAAAKASSDFLNTHAEGMRINDAVRGAVEAGLEAGLQAMWQPIQVTHLKAECGVRYWEDAKVSGVEDEEGSLIPMREGDCWCPTINLATGEIEGWPNGVNADLHYKVCDAGRYHLLALDGSVVATRDGYVPDMLSPGGNGYGDYVIMAINDAGRIQNWRVDLSYFDEGK